MELLIGSIVSILTQVLKKEVSKDWQRIAILVILSLVGAVVYTALVAVGYWQAVYSVLITAAGIYALILRRFESDSN